MALEQLPSADPDSYLPVHLLLFSVVGVVIIEVLMLEQLAEGEGVRVRLLRCAAPASRIDRVADAPVCHPVRRVTREVARN